MHLRDKPRSKGTLDVRTGAKGTPGEISMFLLVRSPKPLVQPGVPADVPSQIQFSIFSDFTQTDLLHF